jgi:hypothetical protein
MKSLLSILVYGWDGAATKKLIYHIDKVFMLYALREKRKIQNIIPGTTIVVRNPK